MRCVYKRTQGGPVKLLEATALTPEDWHILARTIQRRVLCAFRAPGLLADAAAAADLLTWPSRSRGFLL